MAELLSFASSIRNNVKAALSFASSRIVASQPAGKHAKPILLSLMVIEGGSTSLVQCKITLPNKTTGGLC
jgi:hypothetical protein